MTIQIADSELTIMKVLWKNSPLTSAEILSQIEGNKNTIKTLLQRLVTKGALTVEPIKGHTYLYAPAVSQADYTDVTSERFLTKVFDGSGKAMLLNFIQEERITKADLQELLDLIEEDLT